MERIGVQPRLRIRRGGAHASEHRLDINQRLEQRRTDVLHQPQPFRTFDHRSDRGKGCESAAIEGDPPGDCIALRLLPRRPGELQRLPFNFGKRRPRQEIIFEDETVARKSCAVIG